MSTGIQWTDETWNPVVGCTQVSPGCAHCYAKSLHDMRHRAFVAGKKVAPQYAEPFETVQLKPDRLDAPLRWRKPIRIFVNSVSDLFHDDVPEAYIARVFAVMAIAERHTFQVLTKRPARMRAVLSSETFLDLVLDASEEFWGIAHPDEDDPIEAWFPWIIEGNWPLRNVWLGVSVENQRFADERIPLLLRTPAAVRFLSCEPLLGPLDLTRYVNGEEEHGVGHTVGACLAWTPPVDWVIVGGESGAKARPFDVWWAVSLVEQCRAANVVPFVKQLGAVPMEPEHIWRGRAATRLLSAKNSKRVPDGFVPLALHDRHGADMAEWPAELRVREFPAGKVRA